MKRILVTGANGFVGRHVLQCLSPGDWEIHAVSFRAPSLEVPGVWWHKADLLDRGGALKLLAEVKASHLLHLAWYAEPTKYWNSPENFRWVRGTLDMLDAFRVNGGEHIIAAGTCAEYDWNDGFCREDMTPLAPTSIYGICKNSLRQLLSAYGKAYDIRIVWGRIFHLYGPYENAARLVPSVACALLHGEEARCTHGRQIRDFLHVADVAAAFARLAETTFNGVINIGSGNPVTLQNIVELIADRLDSRHRVRFGAISSPPGEPPVIVADNSRLRDCGWDPKYDLERGISETVAWWRSKDSDNQRRCAE